MVMQPALRKVVLTAHVVSSVGWLGAVVTFVAIALIASSSSDVQTVRGSLLLMEPIGWYVLLPLACTALVTGTIQALGSSWGLIRHFWVLFKLVIGTVSTYVLLMFLLTTVGPVTSMAADPASSVDMLRGMAGTPRDHALLALSGLLVATVLALYKPRALTRYGRRNLDRQRSKQRAAVTVPVMAAGDEPHPVGDRSWFGNDRAPASRLARWVRVTGFILGILVWAVLVRVVLGSGGGEGSGMSPDTGGETPGVSDVTPTHQPPAGVPKHGGG